MYNLNTSEVGIGVSSVLEDFNNAFNPGYVSYMIDKLSEEDLEIYNDSGC